MADISSITLPGGGTYDIKDKNAVPKYGMGKNLLDNWYFGNPVNQRGQSNYQGSGKGYTIDRWKRTNAINMTLQTGYIQISNTNWGIIQKGIEVVPGQYTLTIVGRKLTSSGNTGWGLSLGGATYEQTSTEALSGNDWAGYSKTITINTTGKLDFYCSFNSNSGYGPYSLDILAFKVERGTEQTLYHYENGVLVLNEIPDYREELTKCQKYYFDVGATSSIGWIGFGLASVTGNMFSVFVPVPVTMNHENFSVTGTIGWVRGEGADVTGCSLNTTNLYILNNGIGNLSIEKTAGFSQRKMYAVYFTKLVFTAEP